MTHHISLQKEEGYIQLSDGGNILRADAIALSILNVHSKEDIPGFFCTRQRKELAVRIRQKMALALLGQPQQFTWTESYQNKPELSLALLLSAKDTTGSASLILEIKDITKEKIISYTLLSLAKLSHRGGVNHVLDSLAKLMSIVYQAEYVSINLIDNVNYAHAISLIIDGQKQGSSLLNLIDTPSEKIKDDKTTVLIESDAYKKCRKDKLLNKNHYQGYLATPILDHNDNVIAQILILSKHPFKCPEHILTLLSLFNDRVTLEIERLLHERKLQFLASLPQQNPNPIMRVLTNGTMLYTNNPGKEVYQEWQQKYNTLPEIYLSTLKKCQDDESVINQEIEVGTDIYLFTFVWLKEFKQINLYGTNITLLKNTEREIKNLAQYDSLTQVANRQFFNETLNELLKQAKKNHFKFSVLLIDLDNFKTINDTLGHPVGDKLLKTVTRRMASCLRREDFIARLGGDEFVVLLRNTDKNSATMISDKINKQLATRFQIGEYHLNISASIGIAVYPESGQNAEDLLKYSDIAMYQAKRAGGDQTVIASSENLKQEQHSSNIQKKDIKKALLEKQFQLNYQPAFNLSTNEIMSYEAYLRWNHPDKGLIDTRTFIENAEKNGTLFMIGQWSIEHAIREFSETLWKKTSTPLSLNISLQELQHPEFFDFLSTILKQYQVPPSNLILDIPEKILLSRYKNLHEKIFALKELGIKLSLDDFGILLAPFNRLIELPISMIKIDNSLLEDIEINEKKVRLLRGIIDFAKDIGFVITQKGVEKASHNALLKSIGCPNAQGYYYARPIPLQQLLIL